MTGPEANERFGHWVEQCRQQLEKGAAGNALAAWMLSEGVSSDTAAAILRAAQTPPIAGTGPPAPQAAVARDGSAPEHNGAAQETVLPWDGSTQAPYAESSPASRPDATVTATTVVPSPQPPAAAEDAAAVFARAFGRSRQTAGDAAEIEPDVPPQLAPAAAPAAVGLDVPPQPEPAAAPAAVEPGLPPAYEGAAEPAAVAAMQSVMATTLPRETRYEVATPIPPSTLFGTPRPAAEAPLPAGLPDDLPVPDAMSATDSEEFAAPDNAGQDLPSHEALPEEVALSDLPAEPDIGDAAETISRDSEHDMPAAREDSDIREPESFAADDLGARTHDAGSGAVFPAAGMAGPDGEEPEPLAGAGLGFDDRDPPPGLAAEDISAAGAAKLYTPAGSEEAFPVPPEEPQETMHLDEGPPEGGQPALDAEEDEFEFPDSLEDAAARMGMSLSDPLRDPPAESYEDFLGGAQDRDREAEAEPEETPSRAGGKRVIELRDGAGRPAAQPAAEGELARAIREAGEAMPGAVSDAPEGELARVVREAEGQGGDGGAAAHAGPAAEDAEGLDGAGHDIREPEADRAAEPGPPSEEFGPATEEQLARAARELGISFRDEAGAELHEDPELVRAARELGISFRDGPADGDMAAGDTELARTARELGINFRDDEPGKPSKSKRKKSGLARYWPILLLMALAAAAMPVLAVFTMYWSQ